MKQRITYLLPEGGGVDLADIKVGKDSLTFAKSAQAAEEWKLTLGLDELPEEIKLLLEGCHELHFRWTSPRVDRLIPPLVSRLPAGLHVFFTPRNATEEVPLCDLIHRLLRPDSAKCYSVADTFSRPPILSQRFASAATYQYHQYAPISSALGELLLSKACAAGALDSCAAQIRELSQATYIDVDFDAISHAVTLTALFGLPNSNGDRAAPPRSSRPIRKSKAEDRLEVGVLQVEKADEAEELSLGGFLTVIGEDDHPSRTLFSFPSRHHLVPNSRSTFTTSFQHPTGLHPKLVLTLPARTLTPPNPSCHLHAYLTLPSTFFIDRYQLSDPLFLASQNLIALHSLSGEQDLEAPEWVISRWGSAALVEVRTPTSSPPDVSGNWTITIPTHLRYLNTTTSSSPPSPGGHTNITIPWPILFWACEADTGLKMTNNPFDRTNLGFDGLFGPKTMFYHIPPAESVRETVSRVQVPVLDVSKAEWVPVGTLVVVAVGFAWVCWRILVGGLRKDGKGGKKD